MRRRRAIRGTRSSRLLALALRRKGRKRRVVKVVDFVRRSPSVARHLWQVVAERGIRRHYGVASLELTLSSGGLRSNDRTGGNWTRRKCIQPQRRGRVSGERRGERSRSWKRVWWLVNWDGWGVTAAGAHQTCMCLGDHEALRAVAVAGCTGKVKWMF